jgi:hypothetical protein
VATALFFRRHQVASIAHLQLPNQTPNVACGVGSGAGHLIWRRDTGRICSVALRYAQAIAITIEPSPGQFQPRLPGPMEDAVSAI